MHGYEIIRTQFFASASKTSVSISPNGIRFSVACIRKFPETEYIELKVHPYNFILAVVPCNERHKNKLCWARLRSDGISVRAISGGAFIGMLYTLFGWNTEKRYRLRGEIIKSEKDTAALFDARTPEIFSSRYDFEMPWATSFGEHYITYKNARLTGDLIVSAYSEYDNELDLHPSSQRTANKNIRLLIKNMQDGSD
jgi:hypothetical protein